MYGNAIWTQPERRQVTWKFGGKNETGDSRGYGSPFR